MVAAVGDDQRERRRPGDQAGERAQGMSGLGQETGPSKGSADRELLMALRQALLIVLGAVELYLGLERSAPPRRVRRAFRTGSPRKDCQSLREVSDD